jgi:hypothetical protein
VALGRAAHNRKAFAPSISFKRFPHAEGRLELNPIYAVDERTGAGDLQLRLEFPSKWYRFENEGYLSYAPKRVQVPGEVVRALEAGEAHPALDELVRQFVVIGMPDRYQSATLTRP